MKVITTALTELWGLFVEDGSLAVGILVWLLIAGLVLNRLPLSETARAGVLFAGLCLLLVENVLRGARRHQGR